MARIAPHIEQHFSGSATVRDVVIGMSDGLTVPFALAAGISGAVQNHWLVVIAGAAEMAAGSIAMGLGGYLAARSDVEVYASELAREEYEVRALPDNERQEVSTILQKYGLTGDALAAATSALTANSEPWVQFMMKEELGLDLPDPGRALASGMTIGAAYIAGGVIPLAPYVFPLGVNQALVISASVTLLALLLFGWIKGSFTGVSPIRSAAQTLVVGGAAAGVAYAIARLISGLQA